MAYEQKDGQGSLFKNDKKESDTHPDYKGSAKLEGVEYWVSAWIKRPEGKAAYISMSFQPKDAKPAAKPKAGSFDDMDEIPFN